MPDAKVEGFVPKREPQVFPERLAVIAKGIGFNDFVLVFDGPPHRRTGLAPDGRRRGINLEFA